jgi:protoporphyrinogen/coproporphyrinogen III oxidase
MPPRLVIVGGGIAGLAAAWAARRLADRHGRELDIVVLERGPVVGGKARTVARDGWLVEAGPSGFLGGRPEMERLVEEAGLSGDAVPAGTASSRRFIYRAGRMRGIAPDPAALALRGVLSPRGVGRMLLEPFVRARRDGHDESVWDFAARRLGTEVADRLVRPMALGIFAGDARRLSLEAAFPRMAALEREHGSIIRGMIARRGRTASGALSSFRHGMQSLPLALARRGRFTVRCGATVGLLHLHGDQWRVAVEGDAEAIPADGVLLATEPWAAAGLVRPHAPAAAEALDAIPCPPVAVVALGFAPGAAARVPAGFGVLIARDEGFRMLGNLWETHLYPGRGPAGHVLVRAMLGGAVDPGIGALPAPELLRLAREEVARLYGITEPPVFEHVERITRAIPQYEVGHRDRVERVERALARLPFLDATGFGLRGVAFADAASDGVRTGERLAERMLGRADAERAHHVGSGRTARG